MLRMIILKKNIAPQNTNQVNKSSNVPFEQVDITIYHHVIVCSRQMNITAHHDLNLMKLLGVLWVRYASLQLLHLCAMAPEVIGSSKKISEFKVTDHFRGVSPTEKD